MLLWDKLDTEVVKYELYGLLMIRYKITYILVLQRPGAQKPPGFYTDCYENE